MSDRLRLHASRLLLAVLTLLPLAGCFGFGTSIWTADITDARRPGTGRIVLALDASQGPITVGLLPTDLHNCSAASHSTPAGSSGITYVAYGAEPGTYSVGYAVSSGWLLDGDPAEFVVPAGRTVYVGRFIGARNPKVSASGLHLVRDDLATVQKELGVSGSDVELAEAIPGSKQQNPCAPL